jgi:hypothetical protein
MIYMYYILSGCFDSLILGSFNILFDNKLIIMIIRLYKLIKNNYYIVKVNK